MARELTPDAGWLGKRSGVLTVLAMCLTALATAALFIYLSPAGTTRWLNLALGFLVLMLPLVATPPLTRQRLLVAALVWLVLGVAGGYFFGSPVFYAGGLLGAALILNAVLGRSSANASEGAAPMTLGGRNRQQRTEIPGPETFGLGRAGHVRICRDPLHHADERM